MNNFRLKKFKGSFYISGFMATGKSAIGRMLANKLELPFEDLDNVIEQKSGKTIPEIFEHDGEAHFRELEWKYLLELTREFKGVVSLGGGALHNQRVVDHLKVHGLLIYIDTPLDVIVERVRRNPKRPISKDEQGEIKSEETLKIELEALYSTRIEFYKQAEVKVITSGKEPKELVTDRLVDKIKKHV